MDEGMEKRKYRKLIIWAVGVVMFLWLLNLLLLYVDHDVRGVFGDMFGGVNALYSGLAFAGIIYTISMQKDELALQRKELEETRVVFEKQSKIMEQQKSDAQFFNLLENHRQMVQSLERNRFRHNFSNKGSMNYSKELESGYQFIVNLSDEWKRYLGRYSKMYRTKILFELKDLNFYPIDFVGAEENVMSYVNETNNLVEFVNQKFGNTDSFDFYWKILSTSLLESEKYVVGAWEELVSKNRPFLSIGYDSYKHYEYVDFNNCILPDVEVLIKSTSWDENYLFIDTNGIIKRYHTVIEDKSDYNEDKSFHISSKSILETPDGKYQLTMIEYLRESILAVESFPTSDVILKGLATRNYFVIFEILFKGDKYFLPLNFRIREREYWPSSSQMQTKKYFLNFDLERHGLSIETSKELVQILEGNEL